jgi:hypothetical protein
MYPFFCLGVYFQHFLKIFLFTLGQVHYIQYLEFEYPLIIHEKFILTKVVFSHFLFLDTPFFKIKMEKEKHTS